MVPHAIGRTCRVEVFAQHQTTGLLQPQLLLELQGTHPSDGLEVVVQPRDAHAQLARDLLDAQWLVEVLAESLNRSGDVGGVARQDRNVTEPTTLLSHQESVDNFPLDQRQENRRFGSDNHFRQSFYHPVLQSVYNTSRQRTFFSAFAGMLNFSSREDPAVREHEICQTDNKK